MKRFLALAVTPWVFAACVTTVSHSDTVPAAKSSRQTAQALAVNVDSNGGIHTDGWSLGMSDIPELVRQRHPKTVVIRGGPGSSFSKAVEVRNAFKSAGVSDVVIATVDPGAGG